MQAAAGRVFKPTGNMVINGDFLTDQRRNGVTAQVNQATLNNYTMDRFLTYCRFINGANNTVSVQRYPAAGFPYPYVYRLQVLVAGASADANDYGGMQYSVEGYDFAQAGFGSPNASPLAISFAVFATVPGTYGLMFRNEANNRYFATTYQVNVAGAWEQKTIIIPGCSDGVWNITNGAGLRMMFDLGTPDGNSKPAGPAWVAGGVALGVIGAKKIIQTDLNALWHIANLKIQCGTVASPFVSDGGPLNLSKCQRYFEVAADTGTQAGVGFVNDNSTFIIRVPFLVAKRGLPTMAFEGPAADFSSYGAAASVNVNNMTFPYISTKGTLVQCACPHGLPNSAALMLLVRSTANNPRLTADSEL